MRFMKALLALSACLALSAIATDAAHGAEQWTVGSEGSGPGSTLAGQEALEVSGGPFTLTSKVLGAEIRLTAQSAECELACVVFGAGQGEDRLVFRFVTVDPSTCSVRNPGGTVGTISTNSLRAKIIMDPTAGSTLVFEKLEPVLTSHGLAELEFAGVTCPLAGTVVKVKGTVTGQSPNKTGTLKTVQSLTFGPSQQTTGGGALTLGSEPAQLEGTANTKLAGAHEGEAFGSD
jgi:hypothetical protein